MQRGVCAEDLHLARSDKNQPSWPCGYLGEVDDVRSPVVSHEYEEVEGRTLRCSQVGGGGTGEELVVVDHLDRELGVESAGEIDRPDR